jgi:hypothetical protein
MGSSVRRFYYGAISGLAEYLAQQLSIQPGQHYQFIKASDEPRVLVVQVVINPAYLKRVMRMVEELAMAAGLGEGQAIRVIRGSGGRLVLEIPKPEDLRFSIGVRDLPPRHGLRASVGMDTARRPATVNFGDPLTAHGLVAGLPGSGKTNAQQLLVWSLVEHNTPHDVEIVVIDVEKRGLQWKRFDGLAHLAHPVVIEEAEARQILGWAVAEMDRRAQQGRSTPHLFVFIDEIQALDMTGPISRLAGPGREFGVHLVAATQYPTVAALGDPLVKRNMALRLVGPVDDSTAAHVATGKKNTGAELLNGTGDFLLVEPGRDPRRVAVAHLRDDDIAALPRLAEPRFLDLSEYEDLDHVQDVAKTYPRPDDLEPDQVALALASGRGITWLAQELGIGSTKAGRVKAFADRMREKIEALGYALVPVGEL